MHNTFLAKRPVVYQIHVFFLQNALKRSIRTLTLVFSTKLNIKMLIHVIAFFTLKNCTSPSYRPMIANIH